MAGGYTLTLHIGANSFDFQANGYNVLADEGLGRAPVSRKETRGAQQHGSSDRGFTLLPRVFSLGFKMAGVTFREYWDMRDELVRVFRPTEDLFEMRWTFDNGDVRSLDCQAIGGLRYPSSRRSAYADRASVTLKANDPTFYDPNEASEVFALGGGSGSFVIPFVIPWAIGSSVIDQTKTISYVGSWRASPIIKIQGPITDPVITNLLTDETLDFTGYTVGAGDYYEIDTRDGYKTVKDSSDVSQISKLSKDSDLGMFHLEPPVLAQATRNNSLQVTGNTVTAATEIYIRYKVRYGGI